MNMDEVTSSVSPGPRYTKSPGVPAEQPSEEFPDVHRVVTPSSPHPTFDEIPGGGLRGGFEILFFILTHIFNF
jgi:hypothetical protein